jgi:hypothetical protein
VFEAYAVSPAAAPLDALKIGSGGPEKASHESPLSFVGGIVAPTATKSKRAVPVTVQAFAEHVCPFPQTEQALPPLPHACGMLPG